MQLKLFTPSANARTKKRRVRSLQAALHSHSSPDLWTTPPKNERDMALLFLDLRNFTPLTGSFQAFDIVHLVKKLLTAFQRIVRNHHGRIIETTGDGFYAAFGFKDSIEQAVNDSIDAGKAILKYLDMMNAGSFEKNLQRKIEAGIGIHAGKVATGSISLEGEERLMVMGHAVNIASRLQDATKEVNNNFVMSEHAFGLLNAEHDNVAANINLRGVAAEFGVRLIGKGYS